MPRHLLLASLAFLLPANTGCSIRGYAINQIGNAIAGGGSSYESDDDILLVGDALPFGLKLIESLLDEAPEHEGLLLAACKGFTTYSYAYVESEADRIAEMDLGQGRVIRARAGRLYLRAHGYGLRGLEKSRRGFSQQFGMDPETAVLMLEEDDVPLTYWTAAALGLAISANRNNPAMLVRLPEVEALLDRAFELDESWDDGALHEFEVVFADARPGATDYDEIGRHFERAEELSEGTHAALYVAFAESVAVPRQDSTLFRTMLQQALDIDPDAHENIRLVNLIAQERARWLLERTDDLILDLEAEVQPR